MLDDLLGLVNARREPRGEGVHRPVLSAQLRRGAPRVGFEPAVEVRSPRADGELTAHESTRLVMVVAAAERLVAVS